MTLIILVVTMSIDSCAFFLAKAEKKKKKLHSVRYEEVYHTSCSTSSTSLVSFLAFANAKLQIAASFHPEGVIILRVFKKTILLIVCFVFVGVTV